MNGEGDMLARMLAEANLPIIAVFLVGGVRISMLTADLDGSTLHRIGIMFANLLAATCGRIMAERIDGAVGFPAGVTAMILVFVALNWHHHRLFEQK